MRHEVSEVESGGKRLNPLALVYDLTLFSFCILYLLAGLRVPLSEQLAMLIVSVAAAALSSRWVKFNGELLDASSRWLCALACALVYWQARWVLLPESVVPTREGVPWQIPWASLILCLRVVVFAFAFPSIVRSPLSVAQPSVEPSGAMAARSIELQMRLALVITCALITSYAVFSFLLLNARYPADMRIGYTVSVLTKTWEMTALLLMSSHHPTGIVRRDIAMWALGVTVLAKAIIQAALK